MRKHLFTIRWVREGRTARPALDSYLQCEWPLPSELNTRGDARALVAMLDGEANLPAEVKTFCARAQGVFLRLRYNGGDMSGPYVINDDDALIADGDAMQALVDTWDDATLKKYLMRASDR